MLTASYDQEWNQLVDRHPDSSLFHHGLWKTLVESTYGHKADYRVWRRDGQGAVAGVPLFIIKSWLTGNRIVSVPFGDYCDPLVPSPDSMQQIADEIAAVGAEQGVEHLHVKIRNTSHFSAFQDAGFRCEETFKNHVLDLDRRPEELLRTFHPSCVQRGIRKAEREGLHVIEARTLDDMRTFYKMVVETRRSKGLPPQPFRFFENLWNLLHPKGMLHVFLAHTTDRPVAGIAVGGHKSVMYYLYGGCHLEYLSYRPYHLLLWTAIQTACDLGLKKFDFGRTATDNTGLLDFKRRWGTRELDIRTYSVGDRVPAGARMLSGGNGGCRRLIRFCPDSLLQLVGSVLYRHVG